MLLNPQLAGAAGAVVSTVSDLRAFSRTLCRGGLLKHGTQEERPKGQSLIGTGRTTAKAWRWDLGFADIPAL